MLTSLLVGLALATPLDDALNALADGAPERAIGALSGSLTGDSQVDAPTLCLLGELQHERGREEQALATLAVVPQDADCWLRATWTQGEALLALGREAEAGERFAAAGEAALGTPRALHTAATLERVADRLLAQDPPQARGAAAILEQAIGLELPPDERVRLARRLADLIHDKPRIRSPYQDTALRPLLALDAPTDDDVRRIALILADQSDVRRALALMGTLPESAENTALALSFSTGSDASWRWEQLSEALKKWPDAADLLALRLELGLELAKQRRPELAARALQPIAEAGGRDGARARLALASLAWEAGEEQQTLDLVDALLANTPEAPEAANAQRLRTQALERAATRAVLAGQADAPALDRLGEEQPARVAMLRARLALGTGDHDAARALYEGVVSRWPGSSEAMEATWARYRVQARDQGDVEGAIAWLDAMSEAGSGSASQVRAEVDRPYLGVASHTNEAGQPQVAVFSRGQEQVELRLHRIDLAAWLAGGDDLDSLSQLDLSAIEPDTRWEVPVPEAAAHLVQRFEPEVKLPGPGLYALTVASDTHEARTFLLRSRTTLLHTTVGNDVAVAVLTDGQPARNAEVLVQHDGWVQRARTGVDGVAHLEDAGGEGVVVALTPAGPALGRTSSVQRAEAVDQFYPGRRDDSGGPAAALELDRALYLPGDRIGFRLLVSRDEPAPGTRWEAWLEGAGAVGEGARITLEEGADGVVRGELPTPASDTGESLVAALMVASEDGQLTRSQQLVVRPAIPEGRHLHTRVVEDELVARLEEADGSPVVGATLHWRWTEAELEGRAPTDERGELRLAAPRAGYPWSTHVDLPGSGLRTSFTRPRPEQTTLRTARPLQPHLRPDEPLKLRLQGDGHATVQLWRIDQDEALGELPPIWRVSPDDEGPPGWTSGWSAPQVRERGPELLDLVSSEAVELGDEQVQTLAPLAEGRYRIVVVDERGRRLDRPQRQGALEVRVDQAPRVRVADVVLEGEELSVVADGAPALVSASVTGLRPALALPGRPVPLRTERWPEQLAVLAVRADNTAEELAVRTRAPLNVAMTLDASGSSLHLHAELRDGQERPVPSQVIVRVRSTELEGQSSEWPATAPPRYLRFLAPAETSLGSALTLAMGADAKPLSQRLLDERARVDEQNRARAAREGRLLQNRAEAVGGDVMFEELNGMMGLGTRGSGLGGGASAYGLGGGSRGGAKGREVLAPPALTAPRERLGWVAVDVGPDGVLDLDLDRPERAGAYLVEVLAWREGYSASASEELYVEQTELRPAPAPTEPTVASLALAPDSLAPLEPMRAVLAGRAALAALPLLKGEARERALASATSLAESIDPDSSAWRAGATAAQAIALLAELSEQRTLPQGLVASLSEQVQAEGMTASDRVALLWARTRADLPVSESTVARLLREPEALSDADRALLARALVRLDRKREARELATGDSLHALLARYELGEPRKPLREVLASLPPPPLGAPDRVTWIQARALLLPDAPVPASPPAALPEAPAACAQRVPLGTDARWVSAFLRCESEPLRILPGEGVAVRAGLVGAVLPEGLVVKRRSSDGAPLVTALRPGSYVISGLAAPTREREPQRLELVVAPEDPSPLGDDALLALARQASRAGLSAQAWLSQRPDLNDWRADLRADAAALRFRQALRDEAPASEVVATFEDLRDEAPDSELSFEEVLATARAYQPSDPARAMRVERAAVGAAFMDEASALIRTTPHIGPLAALHLQHDLLARYPAVPDVLEQAATQPASLDALAESNPLPPALRDADITRTDLRLLAAAWGRELLARYPEAEVAPRVAQRQAVELMRLDAPVQAAELAQRSAERYADDPLSDELLYLSGLAWSQAGRTGPAAHALRRVLRERFPTKDGLSAPSPLREKASLALARVLEARGEREEALEAYRQAGSDDDARASLALLESSGATAPDTLTVRHGEPAELSVTLTGVDRVELRAYRLDLRTLFLRDGGLEGVRDVRVAGLSPAWTDERHLRERPFPTTERLRLPLREPGAWMVQLNAGATVRRTLVLRSDLELLATDSGGARRLTALRDGKPAAGVPIRAIVGSQVVAATTDARGAAMVPAHAAALAWDGEHYAFVAGHASEDTFFEELHDQKQMLEDFEDELLDQDFAPADAPAPSAPRRMKASKL